MPAVGPMLKGVIRRSYVLCQENVVPSFVAEFVSDDGSEEHDHTTFTGSTGCTRRASASPITPSSSFRATLEVLERINGKYQPMTADASGGFFVPVLNASLGIWQGMCNRFEGCWLRAWDVNGQLLPNRAEVIEAELLPLERQAKTLTLDLDLERRAREQAARRADDEKRRAELSEEKAQKLAARLRELGLDPDQV